MHHVRLYSKSLLKTEEIHSWTLKTLHFRYPPQINEDWKVSECSQHSQHYVPAILPQGYVNASVPGSYMNNDVWTRWSPIEYHIDPFLWGYDRKTVNSVTPDILCQGKRHHYSVVSNVEHWVKVRLFGHRESRRKMPMKAKQTWAPLGISSFGE